MSERLNDHEVRLVRWPAQATLRDRCHEEGVLCLLVVEGGARPPACSGDTEDWVRAPISKGDVAARMTNLRVRADIDLLPRLDESGMLRFRSVSTTISATQTELLHLFVTHFGEVVGREVLRDRLPTEDQCTATRNSLDLHIMRLRRRINPLDLVIRTVWGRGYVLESA